MTEYSGSVTASRVEQMLLNSDQLSMSVIQARDHVGKVSDSRAKKARVAACKGLLKKPLRDLG